MSESLIIREEVFFEATRMEVWDLLINPEKTSQYMFGCALVSDWKIGSQVNWEGMSQDGSKMTYVTGTVLEYEEGKKVVSTTFDPSGEMEDVPRNHAKLSYELTEKEGGILLAIEQGDFAGADNGQQRYEESKAGWKEVVIPKMKEIIGGSK